LGREKEEEEEEEEFGSGTDGLSRAECERRTRVGVEKGTRMAWVELGMRWNDEGGVRSRKKKGEAPHNKDDDDGKSKNSIANCRALKSAYHDCFNRSVKKLSESFSLSPVYPSFLGFLSFMLLVSLCDLFFFFFLLRTLARAKAVFLLTI
jgi:hypothetical protein